MYIFNSETNSLEEVKKCSFKELGLEERRNLQEWIAKQPDSLGEELLIIQKEFDGFSDTRERLDLLALDKNGNLVIIENKLDDSGRDVTWQAIKYASYCSSLSKQDVIDIYQKYLGSTTSAVDSISEFYNGKDITDIELNVGNSQRIIFVAANFRKEVTSSVMWLLDFGLKIKCFKVTPFQYGGRVFLDFDQIIPIKDADEYTIKIASKKQDETQSAEATKVRHTARQEFWADFIDYSKSHKGLYSSSSGTTDSWLGKSIKGITALSLNVCIYNSFSRVEVYINSGEKIENKKIFDFLLSYKEKIHEKIGFELSWQRMDDLITSRIRIDNSELSYLNSDDRPALFEFLNTTSQKIMAAFSEYTALYK